jgi:hypothetical protein
VAVLKQVSRVSLHVTTPHCAATFSLVTLAIRDEEGKSCD